MQRILGVVGALLLVAGVFLPLIVGPSIEGMLGNEPNQFLSTRPLSGVYPQSWFLTGKGEQIIFILLAVACLFGALLNNKVVLRCGAVAVALGLCLSILLTSNRVRHVQTKYAFEIEFRTEEALREATRPLGSTASIFNPPQTPPIDPRFPSSTPTYGLLVMLVGLLCVQVAAWSELGTREVRGKSMPVGIILPVGMTLFSGLLGGGLLTAKYNGPKPQVNKFPNRPGFPSSIAPPVPPSAGSATAAAPGAQRRSRIPTRERVIYSSNIQFSPDGRFLMMVREDTGQPHVLIWSSQGGAPLLRLNSPHTSARWLGPDKIRTNEITGTLKKQGNSWKLVEDSQPFWEMPGEAQPPEPDGFSTTDHSTLLEHGLVLWRLHDGSTGQSRLAAASLSTGKPIHVPPALAHFPDAVMFDSIAVAPRASGQPMLWTRWLMQTKYDPKHPELDPTSSDLEVWDMSQGRMLWKKHWPDWPGKVHFAPGGKYFVAAGTPRAQPRDPNFTMTFNGKLIKNPPPEYDHNGFDVFETRTGKLLSSQAFKDGARYAAISADGTRAAVWNSGSAKDSVIYFLNLPGGKITGKVKIEAIETAPMYNPLFSAPQGDVLAIKQQKGIALFSWRAGGKTSALKMATW